MTAEKIYQAQQEYWKEHQKKRMELVEATLQEVLKGWEEQAKTTGKAVWYIEEDNQNWQSLFKVNECDFSIRGYMEKLKEMGFDVKSEYVSSVEKGHWFWRKTIRNAHLKFTVMIKDFSPNMKSPFPPL